LPIWIILGNVDARNNTTTWHRHSSLQGDPNIQELCSLLFIFEPNANVVHNFHV